MKKHSLRIKWKEWGGFSHAITAFLVVYLALALLSAAVYKIAGKQSKPRNGARSELSSGAAASGSRTSVPGFLDIPVQESGSEDLFSLYDRGSEKKVEITARQLLPAAVACEMDLFAPEEALKAQAVACYTLFCRKRAAGEDILCDSESWQVWTTEEQMRSRWGEDAEIYLALLQNVVDSVYGELLEWNGEPILASYFAISAGNTESAENVWGQDLPYLQASASPGDCFSSGYLSTASFSKEDFQKTAEKAFPELSFDFSGPEKNWIKDLTYTDSGMVSSAFLGGEKMTGLQLRATFSLRSACFKTEYREGSFIFTVQGWGHGVGMSQAGAEFLAKRGKTYREILAHYYPGAVLTD